MPNCLGGLGGTLNHVLEVFFFAFLWIDCKFETLYMGPVCKFSIYVFIFILIELNGFSFNLNKYINIQKTAAHIYLNVPLNSTQNKSNKL